MPWTQFSRAFLHRFLVLGAFVAMGLVSESARADGAIDTVLLKGGGRLRGTVMVDDPKTGVSIRLLDGTTRAVKRADIQEVDYATPQSAAPLPPSAASAPAAQPAAPSSPSRPALPPVAMGAPTASDAGPTTPPAPIRPSRHTRRSYDDGNDTDDDSDGRATPQGSHYETRSLKGLWVAGLVIDLSVWALRGAITAGTCASNQACEKATVAGAAIPVIGAWVELSTGVGDNRGQNPPANAGALVASGIVETAGFVMFVTGLAVHKKVLVRDTQVDLGAVRVAPLLGGSVNGVTLSF